MSRTVWILGAGFSRSLGGPLMNDLLAPELAEDLAVTYDPPTFPKLFDQAARCAHWLHNYGRKFELGEPSTEDQSWRAIVQAAPVLPPYSPPKDPGERFWLDPEVYLSALDTAAVHPAGPRAKRLQRALKKFFERERIFHNRGVEPSIPQIAAAARRLLAAQTASFVQTLDWSEELCAPYIRWADELVGKDDHIISFNYDLVPEKIGEKTGKIAALLPDQKPSGQCPLVLKLHGSVDWMKSGNGKISRESENEALVCDDRELAIATPGPGKLDVSKCLEPLWRMAEEALREATSIVVIGFRFPPADSHARGRLLSAVSSNGKKDLRMHIILGPKTQESDVLRTNKLFEFALRRRSLEAPMVQVEPLGAEDFFSVAERLQFAGPA